MSPAEFESHSDTASSTHGGQSGASAENTLAASADEASVHEARAHEARAHEARTILTDANRSLAERAEALEAFDARALIEATILHYKDDVAVSTAFGPSGLCVLHMAQQVRSDVETYFIDTGFSFPETDEVLRRWTDERKLNVRRILPVLSPEEQSEQHGDRLWERDPDKCCAMRKVEPNLRGLAGKRIWVTALRRDQSETRASVPILGEAVLENGDRILKLCPVARWSKNDVWSYILKHQLPYNQLHDRGYPSVGCTHCTSPVAAGGHERDGRWSGTKKTECGLHWASLDSSAL